MTRKLLHWPERTNPRLPGGSWLVIVKLQEHSHVTWTDGGRCTRCGIDDASMRLSCVHLHSSEKSLAFPLVYEVLEKNLIQCPW